MRALFSSVIAGLFLFQTLAFVFSSSGRIAFSSGDVGASIILTGEICHAAADMGDGGSSRIPSGGYHCALCSAGGQDQSASVVAVLRTAIILLGPPSDGVPTWHVLDELVEHPDGWASTWSSQAPPAIS